MAFVATNPRYEHLLVSHGLTTADGLLAMPGTVVSGHPDRHVLRVRIGGAVAFLKKEHRVPWKDRLANAWAGLGFVSKSFREAVMLEQLRQAGVGCAEWIATGEDDHGRAFVLVREVAGARELREWLAEPGNAIPARLRAFARQLGEALARLHAAGFGHPDLYAKHVLVGPDGSIALLDCQRCRRGRPGWRRRLRALAKLNASLADELAGGRDRLACLRAYWNVLHGRVGHPGSSRVPPWNVARHARWAVAILLRETRRLWRRPRLREMRQPPLPAGQQELVWLDGEALCVTRDFLTEFDGHPPDWLLRVNDRLGAAVRTTTEIIPLSGGRRGQLVRRSTSRPWAWLWGRLRRRTWTAPEVRQAATIFGLQRAGIGTVTLLAFGQHHGRPWRTRSFLLTARPPGSRSLARWLSAHRGPGLAPAALRQRWHVMRQTGVLLRRLHDAGYVLAADPGGLLVRGDADVPGVLVGNPGRVRRDRTPTPARRAANLLAVARLLVAGGLGRTDLLRLYLAYRTRRRLDADAKQWLRSQRLGEWTFPVPAPAAAPPPLWPGTEDHRHEPGLLLPECAAGARRL